jgi:hypothetical protein
MGLVYLRHSDNLAPDATASVSSGTVDPEYPAANLVDLDVTTPGKLTTTTGRWVFDFGSAVSIDVTALINQNLDEALTVRLEANSVDDWDGSPVVPLSVAFTIPAATPDGFRPNPWLDLTAISPRSYRYWSVVVVTANSEPVAIGEVVLGAPRRETDVHFQFNNRRRQRYPITRHRTEAGVSLRTPIGSRQRVLEATMLSTADDADDLRALQEDAAGGAKAFLVIPRTAVNDAWLAVFDERSDDLAQEEISLTTDDDIVSTWSIVLEELVSGLPL